MPSLEKQVSPTNQQVPWTALQRKKKSWNWRFVLPMHHLVNHKRNNMTFSRHHYWLVFWMVALVLFKNRWCKKRFRTTSEYENGGAGNERQFKTFHDWTLVCFLIIKTLNSCSVNAIPNVVWKTDSAFNGSVYGLNIYKNVVDLFALLCWTRQ